MELPKPYRLTLERIDDLERFLVVLAALLRQHYKENINHDRPVLYMPGTAGLSGFLEINVLHEMGS